MSANNVRAPSLIAVCLLVLGWQPGAIAQDAPAACSQVQPDAAMTFFGKKVMDTPSLKSAQARRINAQMGRGECLTIAREALGTVIAEKPDDAELGYLDARSDALAGEGDVAERKLQALLDVQPGMPAARTLQASLLLDREQREQARAMLSEASASQPDDLRTAFQLLRVRALDEPKGKGVGELFQVLRDESLPPDLRETALVTLLYITALDLGQKESALRESLRFESQTPRWDKANNLARLLAEESGKTDEARTQLQSVLADSSATDEAKTRARVLMAETWLLDAAKIDPAPSARNADLVAKATTQVDGNLVPLAGRIRKYHDLSALRPFVAGVKDADERGGDGLTSLCRATQLLNVERVRQALEAGAAVDGECSGSTALAFVVRQGPGFYERKRPILQALLEAGAAPNPKLYPGSSYTAMTFCAEALPGCQDALLPMLNTYAVRRGLPPADIPK